MEEILEGISPTSMREILEAAEWKEGDPVPKGYRVVFGKLRKVGGGGVAGGGAESAPEERAGMSKMTDGKATHGARFFKDRTPEDLSLHGPDADKAAKDISGTIQKLAGWAAKNRDKLNSKEFWDGPDASNVHKAIQKTLKDVADRHQKSGARFDHIQTGFEIAFDHALGNKSERV